MSKIIRQFGEIRKTEEDRTIEFVFSTAAKDRHRTVLNQSGWDLDSFNRNGIAGYMHDVYGDGTKPDPDDIIGRASAWVEGPYLKGNITFEPANLNEKADKIYRKIQFGSLNAVSVGFIEKGKGRMGTEEGEDTEAYYFEGQELIEISVVNIPSNPEALKARDFTPYLELITDLTKQVINNNQMEEKVKNDLPGTSKVEVEVKIDSSKLDSAIDRLIEAVKPADVIPGPMPVQEAKDERYARENFSLRKAILKFADPRTPFDGLEKELHEEGLKQNRDAGIKGNPEGFLVPNYLTRATLQATVTAAGGAAVATDLLGLIDTLRKKMVIMQAGATLMDGLQGNISIPRRSADSTAYWRSEGGVATQSDPTYESVTMEPHRLTAYSRFSRQLLRQSSFSVEAEVRDVLNYAMRYELEKTAFDGAGTSHEPQGIFSNSSVNNADHGSNGTVITWENIVGLESMVAADDALSGTLAYITNTTMGAYLKTLVKNTYQGGFIWEGFTGLASGGMVNGYNAYVTNVLSKALTKGTGTGLSPIIFGDWSALLVGNWGAQEFIVDPYSRIAYDEVNVVTVGYFDFALKHPQSFATIEAGETS